MGRVRKIRLFGRNCKNMLTFGQGYDKIEQIKLKREGVTSSALLGGQAKQPIYNIIVRLSQQDCDVQHSEDVHSRCDRIINLVTGFATERTAMISAKEAAKYLFELYDSMLDDNGKHLYTCSTVKLGKLLTIASFLYACDPSKPEQILLDEDLISLNCGATINNIDFFASFYSYKDGKDSKCVIKRASVDNILCNTETPYHDLLKFVFCKFAAYPQYLLGKLIDYYKPANIKEYDTIHIDDNLINMLSNDSSKIEIPDLMPFKKYIDEYWKQR